MFIGSFVGKNHEGDMSGDLLSKYFSTREASTRAVLLEIVSKASKSPKTHQNSKNQEPSVQVLRNPHGFAVSDQS